MLSWEMFSPSGDCTFEEGCMYCGLGQFADQCSLGKLFFRLAAIAPLKKDVCIVV